MILAAEAAFHETGEGRYRRFVEVAYGWFLGDNELGVRLADPARGGCYDGLTPRGVNLNQGAESTLMWLIALEHVRGMRVASASVTGEQVRAPAPPLSGMVLAQSRPVS